MVPEKKKQEKPRGFRPNRRKRIALARRLGANGPAEVVDVQRKKRRRKGAEKSPHRDQNS